MSLEYTKPVDSLARELSEVSRDAAALRDALMPSSLNFDVPAGFPRDQLLTIIGALEHLPDGTAEGCHVPLETRVTACRQCAASTF
jgi:hypothetical protein